MSPASLDPYQFLRAGTDARTCIPAPAWQHLRSETPSSAIQQRHAQQHHTAAPCSSAIQQHHIAAPYSSTMPGCSCPAAPCSSAILGCSCPDAHTRLFMPSCARPAANVRLLMLACPCPAAPSLAAHAHAHDRLPMPARLLMHARLLMFGYSFSAAHARLPMPSSAILGCASSPANACSCPASHACSPARACSAVYARLLAVTASSRLRMLLACSSMLLACS